MLVWILLGKILGGLSGRRFFLLIDPHIEDHIQDEDG